MRERKKLNGHPRSCYLLEFHHHNMLTPTCRSEVSAVLILTTSTRLRRQREPANPFFTSRQLSWSDAFYVWACILHSHPQISPPMRIMRQKFWGQHVRASVNHQSKKINMFTISVHGANQLFSHSQIIIVKMNRVRTIRGFLHVACIGCSTWFDPSLNT
jgi:hypothetical protein